MEPLPSPRGPGRIILVNGASSSGKSTLASTLRDALDEPFLHVSADQFVAAGMVPARREDGGPFDWWHEVRPPFFAGFHRCLPALAAAGNDLIVEHVIEFPAWRDDLRTLLTGLDVFLIGVHCAPEELDRRERARGDRQIGEGRAHVEINGIHTFGRYDLDVDTTAGVTPELVESVRTAWRQRVPYRGMLWRSEADREGAERGAV